MDKDHYCLTVDCTVDEDKMKIIREKGRKLSVEDGNVTVVAYLYNNFIYIDDVEKTGEKE